MHFCPLLHVYFCHHYFAKYFGSRLTCLEKRRLCWVLLRLDLVVGWKYLEYFGFSQAPSTRQTTHVTPCLSHNSHRALALRGRSALPPPAQSKSTSTGSLPLFSLKLWCLLGNLGCLNVMSSKLRRTSDDQNRDQCRDLHFLAQTLMLAVLLPAQLHVLFAKSDSGSSRGPCAVGWPEFCGSPSMEPFFIKTFLGVWASCWLQAHRSSAWAERARMATLHKTAHPP